MQTFLPFFNFKRTARLLDSKRLNKQIVEAYQILTDRVPNLNHPAYLMWKNSKGTLQKYILVCCNEYTLRFNKVHSIYSKMTKKYIDKCDFQKYNLLFLSHKVNLLRKDYEYYFSLEKYLEFDLKKYPEGYFWPICKGKVSAKHTKAWVDFSKEKNEKFQIYNIFG